MGVGYTAEEKICLISIPQGIPSGSNENKKQWLIKKIKINETITNNEFHFTNSLMIL